MLAPWAPLVVSDPVKLGPARTCPPPLTGENLYELLFQNVLSDNFANLDLWTKVGHKGLITTVPTQTKFAAVSSADDACVRKDYGANFFGDFTSDFDLIIQGASSNLWGVGVWGVSAANFRTIAALLAAADGVSILLASTGVNHSLTILDQTGGPGATYDTGIPQANFPATLYCRVNRAVNVWTLSVYTTAARNVLVGSVNCVGPATAYRYMYAGINRAGGAFNYSFTTQNLTLAAGGVPVDFNDGVWLLLSASETPFVSLAGGQVTVQGGQGGWAQNGIFHTAGIVRAEGYYEIELQGLAHAANARTGTLGLSTGFTALPTSQQPANSAGFVTYYANTQMDVSASGNRLTGQTVALTNGTWYKLRCYARKGSQANWTGLLMTITGGAEYPAETALLTVDSQYMIWGTPLSAWVQKQVNSAVTPIVVRSAKWFFGYPIDGPTGVMVADAGAGKFFIKFTPTNITATGGWVTTNALFQYSYDNGVPAWNGVWLTLAQLCAVLAITANRRYLRIAAQANSNGITQQYIGFVNAADILAVPDAATGGNPKIAVNSKNAF